MGLSQLARCRKAACNWRPGRGCRAITALSATDAWPSRTSRGVCTVTAYNITEVEILDEDARSHYVELSKAAVAQHGGRFLVQGAEPTVAEGER